MAPPTRSAPPSSSSPLFQRLKAELKKNNEENHKKRREAVPETLRRSTRKSAASIRAANAAAAHAAAATMSTETSETPVATATSSRRVTRATSSMKPECETLADNETEVSARRSSVKRKCAEEKANNDTDDEVVPARPTKKLRSASAARDKVTVQQTTAAPAVAVTATRTVSTRSALAKRAQVTKRISPRTAAREAAALSTLKGYNMEEAANAAAAPDAAITKSTETSQTLVAAATSSHRVIRATSSIKRQYETVEEDKLEVATQSKKQKNAHCAGRSSVKRKCPEEKTNDNSDEKVVPARTTKKLRSTSTAKDTVIVRRSTAGAPVPITTIYNVFTGSAVIKGAQAAKRISPRTAAREAAALPTVEEFNGPEDIRSLGTEPSNGSDEVIVTADGLDSLKTKGAVGAGDGFDSSKTEGAVTSTVRPAKKEEVRKGEKEDRDSRKQQVTEEINSEGEMEKEKEINGEMEKEKEIQGEEEKDKESNGKIVISSSPASSLQVSKTTPTIETSTHEVEDDHNCDDILFDSDSDNFDYDTDSTESDSDNDLSHSRINDPLLQSIRQTPRRHVETSSPSTSRAVITEEPAAAKANSEP